MTTARSARLLLVFLLTSCTQASPLQPGMDAVSAIRGKAFLHDVKTISIDRADLSKHLHEQMVNSTPYPLDDWATMLRALQLVDTKSEDLVPQLLALYESQVLAFYDPHSHTYYSIKQLPKLPESATKLADPKTLEEMVMVHELTHALQDQHFKLGEKEKKLLLDTDANLAYHAVLEGEAVLVMVAHILGKSGLDFDEVVKNDAMLNMITSATQADQMIDPSTPKYFGDMLKFPYLEGLNFVVQAYRRGGWKELDRIHADPPRTTREIFHPEEYFGRTFKPQAFDATKPANAISAEHLGEFHWRFLVGEDNARGWVNDRAVVTRDGKVQIDTTWESPERAAAFATAYGAFLKKRGIEATIQQKGSNATASYTAK
ncbi:MAG TPA: hypothetical protein VGQ76_15190 [Thermoanaerobaculia bacterium]|jgi:hypothetical protein|nr:hypothetical protein [Thermoanaerobaculia bacterium]